MGTVYHRNGFSLEITDAHISIRCPVCQHPGRVSCATSF